MADDVETTEETVTPPTKPEPAPASKKTAEEIQVELDKTARALKAANAEALKHRKRIEEIEAAEEKQRQESLSEDEKRTNRLKAAEEKVREVEEKARQLERDNYQLRVDRLVEDEAKRQGISDPRLIPALVRGNGGMGIEIDPESGKAIGIKDAVDRLLKDFPDLMNLSGMPRGRGTPQRVDSPYRVPPRSTGNPKTDAERAHEQDMVDANDLSGRFQLRF